MRKMPNNTKRDQINQLVLITRYGETWTFEAQEVATKYLQDILKLMDFHKEFTDGDADKHQDRGL